MIPRRFFWLFDLVILTSAFCASYLITPLLQPFFRQKDVIPLSPFGDLLWICFTITPVALLVLALLGNDQSVLRQSLTLIFAGAVIAPWSGVSLVSLILFALRAPGSSRVFLFLYGGLITCGLLGYRLLFRAFYRYRQSRGHYCRNIVLLGSTASIEKIVHFLLRHLPRSDGRLLGYLKVSPDQLPPLVDPTLPLLGNADELGNLMVHQPIHDVILVLPTVGGKWIEKAINDCDYFGVRLRIIPEALLHSAPSFLKVLHPVEELKLPSVVLTPRDWDSEAAFLKRAFDIAVSGLLLLVLSPIFLAVAIAIKITTPKLSILFRWRVIGRNGVEFTGYKFTTMVSNADQLKSQLYDKNEMVGPVFKIRNDPRITPLGRFLRKYSLNELPQLWSVLKGDMSLVGPRPAFRHELDQYQFWHKRKLSINPGITCLWQVRGRNKISNFDDWVNMDLEYIDNWSLWLDLKILIRTTWVVISGTGM